MADDHGHDNLCFVHFTAFDAPAKGAMELFSTEFRQALEGLSVQRGFRLHTERFRDDRPLSDWRDIVASSRHEAFMLFAARDASFAALLTEKDVPWMAAFPRCHMYSHRVVMDSRHLTAMQLEHLFELGHRRIAFMDPVLEPFPNMTSLYRRGSYFRLMAERGLAVEPDWCLHGGYSEEEITHALTAMFATDPPPTAVIVADSQLPVVYRFLHRRGVGIGSDCSVMATDDMSVCERLHPTVTSTHNSPAAGARLALNMLTAIRRGCEPDHTEYVPCRLAIRDSTGLARDL